MKLTIHMDEDRKVEVTEAEAPELHAAYKAWQSALRSSSHECHAWQTVMELAADYLDQNGHKDAEVFDVSEAE